jgi:hypothetical protein
MKLLDLRFKKINICPNFCMMYYSEYVNFIEYKTYQHAQYKPNSSRGRTLVTYKKVRYFLIILGLQRLIISSKTVVHMIWHHSYDAVDEVIMHFSNDEAYKQFNKMHTRFLIEPWNMYLGLCTNKFNLFGSFVAIYSCWLVILTVYNLLSRMCIKIKLMFLFVVIPDPYSLSRGMYVFLEPLIDKLN